MPILKILFILLITAVLSTILKQHKSEYALILSIFGSVLVLGIIVKNILVPITVISTEIEKHGISLSYFKVALKALGIGYITTFIANSCKDAGQTSLAAKAELAGKCAIFMLCLPLCLSVLETALGFIK